MKTLMLYNEFDHGVSYLEFEGDMTHLNNVYLNGTGATKEQLSELNDLLYDSEGEWIGPKKLKVPTKDWDYYCECGFYP